MTFSPYTTEIHSTNQKSSRNGNFPGYITIHHGATRDAQWMIDVMVSGSKQVSSGLVIKDKRIAGIVPEEYRAWSLSDAYWDSVSLTVETANETTAPGWTISDDSYQSLAKVVADWCVRYGIPCTRERVIGHREVYTRFGGSYATACPGGIDLDTVVFLANQILNPVKRKKISMQFIYSVRPDNSIIQKYLCTDNGLSPINDVTEEIIWRVMGSPTGSYTNLYPSEVTALDQALRAAGSPATGGFGPTDRAMLDDIATKAELAQALTSTVSLVNDHADTNKNAIIAKIDTIPGSAGAPLNISLTGTASPE